MSEPRVSVSINGVAKEVFEVLKSVLEVRTIKTGERFFYATNITPEVILLSDDIEVTNDNPAT